MDVWMLDVWVAGWMDGWLGGCLVGRIDRLVDGWMYRRMEGWIDEWKDRCIHGRIFRHILPLILVLFEQLRSIQNNSGPYIKYFNVFGSKSDIDSLKHKSCGTNF